MTEYYKSCPVAGCINDRLRRRGKEVYADGVYQKYSCRVCKNNFRYKIIQTEDKEIENEEPYRKPEPLDIQTNVKPQYKIKEIISLLGYKYSKEDYLKIKEKYKDVKMPLVRSIIACIDPQYDVDYLINSYLENNKLTHSNLPFASPETSNDK